MLRLIALLNGTRIGEVHQDQSGRLRFIYDDEWRERTDAYPLSVSMPLSSREHPHRAIDAYLWGLLPDNRRILENYARLFSVSASNPVALLANIGADCPGAVQFAPPDRVDELLSAAAEHDVEWLTDSEVETELRIVREEGLPGSGRGSSGQFSLAGAQPKTALLEEDGRWGRPRGRTPTNRILKPPTRQFRGFAENEHFCLEVAAELGLGAVRSRVLRFGSEVAIVVDRFDRLERDHTHYRVHQEDFCQAVAITPTRKYENEGGPGVRDIALLLRDYSVEPNEDVDRFLQAIALNWILAATDGHAKNYALLHAPGGTTRLAPFYDIASFLPYEDAQLHRVKLAMKIGSEYLVRRVARADWESLARSIGIPPKRLLEQIDRAAMAVLTSVDDVRGRALREGLDDHEFINLLADRVKERSRECLRTLGSPISPAD